eukprot:GHRR01025735.1.p1 GENE.GHRR01025735.1~~GHRR01025735.1.p1  ORF type:complete len:251 (-),score=74.82 GHRR01025735.1:376-1128(-)
MYAISNGSLQHAKPLARSGPARNKLQPLGPVLRPVRSVVARFREGERDTSSTKYNNAYDYNNSYNGYSDDPYASLRNGWNELKQRWDDWSAEERTRTLTYTAATLLALYIGNSVLFAIERVPLVPNFLKLVGFGFSGWFYFKYLLYADGRKEFARDFTIEKLVGRVNEAAEDLSANAKQAKDRFVADNGSDSSFTTSSSSANKGSSGRATGGISKLSSGENRGYSGAQLDSNITGALHGMDKITEEESQI